MTDVTYLLVMHSPVLLYTRSRGLVMLDRPRLRHRLVARWRAARLDRALAAGTPPEASAALALRAQRLIEPERRHCIALALRRVLHEGSRPRRTQVVSSAAPLAAAVDPLGLLADTLDEPGPVSAQGVAQALLLLTDGTGPLYNPRASVSLPASAARATRALRPALTLY
jgi:hypothetical protein